MMLIGYNFTKTNNTKELLCSKGAYKYDIMCLMEGTMSLVDADNTSQ